MSLQSTYRAFFLVLFVLGISLGVIRCDGGSSASTASDDDGDGGGDTATLTTDQAVVVAQNITLTPADGSLRVVGAAGSFASDGADSTTCDAATVSLQIGDQTETVTAGADCSFDVTTTIPDGETTASLVLEVGAASSESEGVARIMTLDALNETPVTYDFTIPEEESTLTDASFADLEIMTFDTPEANTEYTVCVFDTEAADETCADTGECLTIDSGDLAQISVALEVGQSAEFYYTDPTSGESTCERRTAHTDEDIIAGDAEYDAAEVEYEANVAASEQEPLVYEYEEEDAEEVSVDARVSSQSLQSSQPRAFDTTLPATITVDLNNLRLRINNASGQKLRESIDSGTCTEQNPCKGFTHGYTMTSGLSSTIPFNTSTLNMPGYAFSKKPQGTLALGVIQYNNAGIATASPCRLSPPLVSDPDKLSFTTYVDGTEASKVYVVTSSLSFIRYEISALRVRIKPNFSEWTMIGAIDLSYNYNQCRFIGDINGVIDTGDFLTHAIDEISGISLSARLFGEKIIYDATFPMSTKSRAYTTTTPAVSFIEDYAVIVVKMNGVVYITPVGNEPAPTPPGGNT